MIKKCERTGLWLLPQGPEAYTRHLPSWDDLWEAAREVALYAAAESHREDKRLRRQPTARSVRRVFGLLPCPEDGYNEQAVAVVAPGLIRGHLEPSRQIAWLKDEYVRSLQPSILALMDATGELVGCTGLVELDSHLAGEDYDADAPPLHDPDDTEASLEERAARHLGYAFRGFRADIDTWSVVRDDVLEIAHTFVSDRILPVISHRSGWVSGLAARVIEEMRDQDERAVELRATPRDLKAYYASTLIAELHPHPREFFARTHRRVAALGGAAAAVAVAHAKTLELFIEESAPL